MTFKNSKFLWIALVIFIFWVGTVSVFAPLEATQGWSQKIFYFHVTHAIFAYIFFIVGTFLAILGLVKKRKLAADVLKRWENWSVACIEMGVLCCTVVLVTGPIWAKPIWGQFWTWEPRLTFTLFMWLIFIGALSARTAFSNHERGQLAFSILTVLGCLNIPLVRLAVTLWRGVHPSVLRNPEGLSPTMKGFFLLSLLCALGFLFFIFRARIQSLDHERGS